MSLSIGSGNTLTRRWLGHMLSMTNYRNLLSVPLPESRQSLENHQMAWQWKMRSCTLNSGKMDTAFLCGWGSKDASFTWLETKI